MRAEGAHVRTYFTLRAPFLSVLRRLTSIDNFCAFVNAILIFDNHPFCMPSAQFIANHITYSLRALHFALDACLKQYYHSNSDNRTALS